jgi:hypothetical protein
LDILLTSKTHAYHIQIDIPKANYASSITSIGSSGSKKRGKLIPAAAASSGSATLPKSLLSAPVAVQRPTTKSVQRTSRANKVLATLWLLSASAFRRLDRMEESLRAIEEAEYIDASNPDVWYNVSLQEFCLVPFTVY